MAKRRDSLVVLAICVTLLPGLIGLQGCSNEPPQPQPQATPPAMVAPQTQAPPQMATPQPQPAPATATSLIPANIAQLRMGMTSQQVLQILGNPSKVKPKDQYVEWEYWTPQGKFELKLQADQLVAIERN